MGEAKRRQEAVEGDAREIFLAGQALLRGVHAHLDDRGLSEFDHMLARVYNMVGLDPDFCDGCDADVPSCLLVKEGQRVTCPACGKEGTPEDDGTNKKMTVSYDVRVAGLIEVEAPNEEAAVDQVMAMDPAYLLKLANTETAEVIVDGVDPE